MEKRTVICVINVGADVSKQPGSWNCAPGFGRRSPSVTGSSGPLQAFSKRTVPSTSMLPPRLRESESIAYRAALPREKVGLVSTVSPSRPTNQLFCPSPPLWRWRLKKMGRKAKIKGCSSACKTCKEGVSVLHWFETLLHCLTVYDKLKQLYLSRTCFLLFKVKEIATRTETSWFCTAHDIYHYFLKKMFVWLRWVSVAPCNSLVVVACRLSGSMICRTEP